jgi:hypothetical protein
MRPIFFDHPFDGEAVRVGVHATQFTLGQDIMAVPVVSDGQRSVSFYLPRIHLPRRIKNEGELSQFEKEQSSTTEKKYPTGVWYNFYEHNVINNFLSNETVDKEILVLSPGYHSIPVTLASIPIFIRGILKKFFFFFFFYSICIGGAIIPLWNHPHRSSLHQLEDPITLVVAPDENVLFYMGFYFPCVIFRMKQKEEFILTMDSHTDGPSLTNTTIVNFLCVLFLLVKEKPRPRNLLLKI